MLKKTITEIAELVQGQIIGSGATDICGVASLKEASASELSFLGNKKYVSQVADTQAGVVLVPHSFDEKDTPQLTLIKVDDPSDAFSKVIDLFAPPEVSFGEGVHPTAYVDSSAELAEGVVVGPCAVIEAGAVIGLNSVIGAGSYIGHEAKVGADCLIYPNVTVRERVQIGNEVIIHSGTVVGSDGFGFKPGKDGHTKIPQVGIVQVDDRVEIGANVAIDRARFGKTWIKSGAKIDNLVHIAHNVVIGHHCFIVAQVGIAGSTVLGNGVIAAGQAGFSGHLEIGDGVVAMGKAGVTKDLKPGEVVFGIPAVPRREHVRQTADVKKVKGLVSQVKELEQKIAELSAKFEA